MKYATIPIIITDKPTKAEIKESKTNDLIILPNETFKQLAFISVERRCTIEKVFNDILKDAIKSMKKETK